jgi:acetyltransferase-like isoleucine patch superfamily enzyme
MDVDTMNRNILNKLLAFKRYPEFLQLLWWRVVTPRGVRRRGVELARGVEFFGAPVISLSPGSRITVDTRASLCSDSRYTALGVNHPVVLRTLNAGALIEIGADTGISGASICAATKVSIGANCLIGANAVIADTDFHSIRATNRRYDSNKSDLTSLPVFIGSNVFIGTGAIILKGVRIGENSIIGAGSVVTRSIPDNTIAAGNPAVVVGTVLP